MRWAEDLKKNPRHADQKVQTPAVLGAVISLNNCLDLLDVRSIELVKRAYTDYLKTSKLAGVTIPQNIGGVEQKARYLDCAVINSLHQRIEEGEVPFDNLTTFDSVRAMFPEGEPLYPNAGFRKQNHIQICIRNADCVKGLFVPRKSHGMIV
ncbi:MAG: hypothetical protein Q8922_01440 [Bacteroidota bacterium]|nr:hypothetical protein [Bacteroidota bacterium]MDP4286575.1 hypothetical protein [Bacteroidota bacterium]